jgi:hypothetical protein
MLRYALAVSAAIYFLAGAGSEDELPPEDFVTKSLTLGGNVERAVRDAGAERAADQGLLAGLPGKVPVRSDESGMG